MILDLHRLNSLTKYPSIPTYHPLGEKGVLQPLAQIPIHDSEPLSVTEKVDGTNSRIVIRLFGGDLGKEKFKVRCNLGSADSGARVEELPGR